MKKAIVVGSGAGGATAAKELQGKFEVTILEAGRRFRPFSLSLETAAKLKKAGLLFSEKEIPFLFPAMRIQKTAEKMVLVKGIGTGGTTPLATGNALRQDHDLIKLGIHLDREFEELHRDIPVSTAHQKLWRETTRRLFRICAEIGLDPRPTPKMGDYERCRSCGRCILGCPHGVKWDSRQFMEDALAKGARLITNCRARRISIKNGRAVGVLADTGWRRQLFAADVIILAAGGLGTPLILQDSGIACEPGLFVDPVLCVAAEWPGASQNREMPMPFVVQRDGYILSPYFDPLSYFFNRKWKQPPQNILSLMIKLADASAGSVSKNKVNKVLTAEDNKKLAEAAALCADILGRMGIEKEKTFFGTVNAGHPGGMLPLTSAEAATFHSPRLPDNLYIADATLLPHSLGNPPILTIMALAKRVSKICAELAADLPSS